MDKKAQGLSINVIIIVAIALIVLVVLVAVFTGNLGLFSKTISSTTGDATRTCTAQGGAFKVQSECTGKIITSSDSKAGEVCCVGGDAVRSST